MTTPTDPSMTDADWLTRLLKAARDARTAREVMDQAKADENDAAARYAQASDALDLRVADLKAILDEKTRA